MTMVLGRWHADKVRQCLYAAPQAAAMWRAARALQA
jgi:hypothetical protein